MREFEFDRLVDAFRAKSPDEGLDVGSGSGRVTRRGERWTLAR
ncbi:MAG: hypothetical protein ABI879_00400 [Actinomycetota bacterium]